MLWKALQADEVTFRLVIEPEMEPVRGNAVASGDEALDREIEDGLIARLNSGDDWAWFTATVEASWRSPDGKCYTGEAYLGCCSYRDEDDFRGDAYFSDMQKEALDALNSAIENAVLDADRVRAYLMHRPSAVGWPNAPIVWGGGKENYDVD